MSDDLADYAILGSTPFARLLAGLLADAHGRQVVHVGESQSSYRLPRGIDLSVAPMTRPESWAMALEGTAETIRLIGRVAGRSAWSHVDPIFFTDDPRAMEALSHMRHMALGFGLAAEPASPSLLGTGRMGVMLRDAVRLNRAMLEPALDSWMEQQGVRRISPESVTVSPDGRAILRSGDTIIEARQAVLADNDAIVAHLPQQQWPALLRRSGAAAILTTPTRPLAAPIMLELHSGITLLQQPEGGIAAFGPNGMAVFSDRVQGLLDQQRQVEQAGQTAFSTLATQDGGPAFGRVAGTGADIAAGMGPIGAFLAPALARWLCGAAKPHEAAWFGARLITRAATSSTVADFVPSQGGAA